MSNNLIYTFNASDAKDLVAKYRSEEKLPYINLLEEVLLEIKKMAEKGWYSHKHRGSLPSVVIRTLEEKGFSVLIPPPSFYHQGEDIFYRIEWKNGI